MPELTGPEIVAEFQGRRRETWRRTRLWMLVALVTFGVLFLAFGSGRHRPEDMQLWQLNVVFGSFITLGVSFGVIGFAVRKHYRCPACDSIPQVINGGVLIDPAKCPNCGVRLR